MLISPGERVLELVEVHRQEAKLYERRGLDGEAKLLRSIALDYEKLVKGNMPEWVPISDAQASRGRSPRWWRDKCRELAREGMARKTGSGRWEIHRSAMVEIPRKSEGDDEIPLGRDMRELAEELAGD